MNLTSQVRYKLERRLCIESWDLFSESDKITKFRMQLIHMLFSYSYLFDTYYGPLVVDLNRV